MTTEGYCKRANNISEKLFKNCLIVNISLKHLLSKQTLSKTYTICCFVLKIGRANLFAYSFLFIWILSVSNRTVSRLQALMISAGET